MADDTDTILDDDTATGADQNTDAADLGEAGKRALQEVRREAREARSQLKAANAELEKLRSASMSEQERAVAEAKAAGVAEASRAAAPRLVRAELRAAAAEAGLGPDALAGFLEYADLSRFVGDDGQVNDKAVSDAISKLGGGRPADFDGGARSSAAKSTDMNSLIRRAAGVS